MTSCLAKQRYLSFREVLHDVTDICPALTQVVSYKTTKTVNPSTKKNIITLLAAIHI